MSLFRTLCSGLLLCLLSAGSLWSCTTFCFPTENGWVYGRNYDWMADDCLIMVNKRDMTKRAATEDNPLTWTSRYGSVTFNQYGREFPLGGMNEAGLVIECMWLEQTEYPVADARKGIGELQWIQFQLDTSASVAEVIASSARARITLFRTFPLHFLVCDRQGDAAVIEYLEGVMRVYTGSDLPYTALTNNTYAYCRRFTEAVKNNEEGPAFRFGGYSLKRFLWAAKGAMGWKGQPDQSAIDYAFAVLAKAAVEGTQFRIVYHSGEGRVHFQTKRNSKRRWLDAACFDFACSQPCMVFPIHSGETGDITKQFVAYTYEQNLELLQQSYQKTPMLKNVSQESLVQVAKLPDTFSCAGVAEAEMEEVGAAADSAENEGQTP